MPYKQGKKWRGVVKIGGTRRTKLFDKKADARAWEDETKRQLKNAIAREQEVNRLEVGPVTVGYWLETYLDDIEANFSVKTLKEKRLCYREFIDFLKDPGFIATKLEKEHVRRFLQHQRKHRSGYAANKDRKNLLAAWNWGVEYLDFPENSPFKVRKFREERHPRYVPPPEDFYRVLEAVEGQDRLLLLTCFLTAARRSEVFRLKWDDIFPDRRQIRLWTRKRKNSNIEEDYLEMPDVLCHELMEHRKRQDPPSEYVFVAGNGQPYVTRQKWLQRLCKRVGVEPFGFHGIRHLSASLAATDANIPVQDIQNLLRHKSIKTTQQYLQRFSMKNRAVNTLADLLPDGGGRKGTQQSSKDQAPDGGAVLRLVKPEEGRSDSGGSEGECPRDTQEGHTQKKGVTA
jgi:integrase